jgi:hypothetical protein
MTIDDLHEPIAYTCNATAVGGSASGLLFIWQKSISYLSQEPLVAHLNLPLSSMSHINKRNQGVLLRNAIEIIADKEYGFTGFQNRDEVYNVLECLWRYRNKRVCWRANRCETEHVISEH